MITVKRFSIIALMLLANICHSNEQKHPIDVKLDECLSKKENMNTAGMVNCTVSATEAWDGELNLAYKELSEKLSPDGKEKLKSSQLAWIKHRDLEYKSIDAVYSDLQGTMYMPMRAMSIMQVTKNRALELKAYVSLHAI